MAAYLGCVGNDENASTLRKVAEAAGVDVLYLVDDKEPTGLCAVLLNGKNRYGRRRLTNGSAGATADTTDSEGDGTPPPTAAQVDGHSAGRRQLLQGGPPCP